MLPVHNISELRAQVPSSCTDKPNSNQKGDIILTITSKSPLAILHYNKLLFLQKRVMIALVTQFALLAREGRAPKHHFITA